MCSFLGRITGLSWVPLFLSLVHLKMYYQISHNRHFYAFFIHFSLCFSLLPWKMLPYTVEIMIKLTWEDGNVQTNIGFLLVIVFTKL
jgi:hypothetical protein